MEIFIFLTIFNKLNFKVEKKIHPLPSGSRNPKLQYQIFLKVGLILQEKQKLFKCLHVKYIYHIANKTDFLKRTKTFVMWYKNNLCPCFIVSIYMHVGIKHWNILYLEHRDLSNTSCCHISVFTPLSLWTY